MNRGIGIVVGDQVYGQIAQQHAIDLVKHAIAGQILPSAFLQKRQRALRTVIVNRALTFIQPGGWIDRHFALHAHAQIGV